MPLDSRSLGKTWVDKVTRGIPEKSFRDNSSKYQTVDTMDVWAISELFYFCEGMSVDQKCALGWLLLLYSVHQAQGSTCISLAEMFVSHDEHEWIKGEASTVLLELGATKDEIQNVQKLVQDLRIRSAPELDRAPQPYDVLFEYRQKEKTSSLKRSPDIQVFTRPFVLDGLYLFSRKNWKAEQELGEKLRARLNQNRDLGNERRIGRHRFHVDEVEAAIEDVLANPPVIDQGNHCRKVIRISKEQVNAIRGCFSHSFSVLTGGPGTGKTSFIVAFLRVLSRLNADLACQVVLCAPTGKAADRMQRSIINTLSLIREPTFSDLALIQEHPKASTIHRLLGYSQVRGVFRYHRENPFLSDMMIVDEASMMDLSLMHQLVDAVGEQVSFLFVGDAEQLPPVGQGAVFKDLTQVPDLTMRLSKNYRVEPKGQQVSPILQFAEKIRKGESSSFKENKILCRVQNTSEFQFQDLEIFSPQDAQAFTDFLEFWYVTWFTPRIVGKVFDEPFDMDIKEDHRDRYDSDLKEIFSLFELQKILCADRRGMFGVDHLNAWFRWRHHQQLERRLEDEHRPELLGPKSFSHATSSHWLLGEPVMVNRNDYVLDLFNGDQGVVTYGKSNEEVNPWVVFLSAEGFRFFPLVRVQHLLESSFAMTVHKAQGSEAEHVGFVFPSRPSPLWTRELVYTAVTRAKKSVTMIGDELLIQQAVNHPTHRQSRFSKLLILDPHNDG